MDRRKVNIDELSDDELENFLAQDHRGVAPTKHQLEGGAPRAFSLLMILVGVCGVFASVELLRAEKQLLLDSSTPLTCDINPLIGCSTFLGSPQNELFFGTSNAVFGLAFFTGIFALGMVLVSGGKMGRWLWLGLDGLMVLATAWLVWFQWTSITVERALCPYCLLVWTVTIPLIINTWARSAQAGHMRLPGRCADLLLRGRWYIVAAVYSMLIAIIIVAFWDTWPLVF